MMPMVRAACSDGVLRAAGDARKPLVTRLVFPLSSLDQRCTSAQGAPRTTGALRATAVIPQTTATFERS